MDLMRLRASVSFQVKQTFVKSYLVVCVGGEHVGLIDHCHLFLAIQGCVPELRILVVVMYAVTDVAHGLVSVKRLLLVRHLIHKTLILEMSAGFAESDELARVLEAILLQICSRVPVLFKVFLYVVSYLLLH